MKTHFAKILPILLAMSLLIGLIPLAGLMASAEVQAPPDGFTVVNADGKDHEIDAQNHNEWQPANGDVDLSGAAKNARLGFYFDTTAIAYDATQGDKNNYAFYIDVWVKGGSGWKSIAFSDDKMERVFTRDGKETTVTGHIKGEEQSYFCLPVNATGYIYISLGDDVDTSSVVALKLSPVYDWGTNLPGKTIKARNIGFFGAATPGQPGDPQPPKEAEQPKNYTVYRAEGCDYTVNGNSSNSCDVTGLTFPAGDGVSKLAFYYDARSIVSDNAKGDKDGYAFFFDIYRKDGSEWETVDFGKVGTTRYIVLDGEDQKLTSRIDGKEPGYLFNLIAGTYGYLVIDLGEIKVKDVDAFRLRPEWGWNDAAYGQTIKIRDIGFVTDPAPQPPRDPEPFYGDNYIVTNNNVQNLHIENGMRNDLTLDLSSNAKAPAEAKAIAFRYDTTAIPDEQTSMPDRHNHASYWSLYAGDVPFSGNIDKAEANGFKFLKFRQVYRQDDVFHQDSGQFNWVNTIPLRATGYVLIDIEQIQDYAQFYLKRNVTVADIGKLVMLQEWGWNADLYDRDLSISDVGYVMDPEAFIAAYQQSFKNEYEQHPLDPAGSFELKVGAVEGDFAELSWGEADGAKRYLINRYDKDGKFLATETTRRTKLSLQGLDKATAYRLQVLAIGENDAVLAASNVADITTLAQNMEPYMKGLLEYDAEFTATVKQNGSAATVEWEWIGGVDSYAVHLYEKNGDALTFVKREVRSDKTGSMTFDGLEDGKTYIAQVVSYDASGSIIYAYAPTAAFAAGGQSTDEPGKTDDGKTGKTDDSPVTGVALPGAVMLLAVLSGGAAAVSRKRRG